MTNVTKNKNGRASAKIRSRSRKWLIWIRSFGLRFTASLFAHAVCLLLLMPAAYAQSLTAEPAAPGLAYTPEQMWKRLLEIAEGPIPSREALEREFGFQFRLRESTADERDGIRTYYGTAASPPFATPQAPQFSNIGYDNFKEKTLIDFQFDPKRAGINKPIVRYCVESEYLFKAMEGKWERDKREQGHYAIAVDYTATFQGVQRKITIAPIYLSSEPCLQGFYIDYTLPNTKKNQK